MEGILLRYKSGLIKGEGSNVIFGRNMDPGANEENMEAFAQANGERLNHQTFVSGFAEYMVIPEQGAIKVHD